MTSNNPHLIDGDFQSDKYPTTPHGKVPLSTQDPAAHYPLALYARRRRAIDPDFSDALEAALKGHGYDALHLRPADMPPADAIIDYGNGRLSPVMFHWAVEGQDLGHIAREAGFECRWITMNGDLKDGHELLGDYFEYGASADEVLPKWQPTEQGDGWVLSGKWDVEDGPVAVFLRPLGAGGQQ